MSFIFDRYAGYMDQYYWNQRHWRVQLHCLVLHCYLVNKNSNKISIHLPALFTAYPILAGSAFTLPLKSDWQDSLMSSILFFYPQTAIVCGTSVAPCNLEFSIGWKIFLFLSFDWLSFYLISLYKGNNSKVLIENAIYII